MLSLLWSAEAGRWYFSGCLERDPVKRPVSALAVSAALPGGDQLAAALAAGETPSPEMVAAAGEQSAVQPAIGLALVAFTFAMLTALTVASDRFAVINRIPFPRTSDSLGDRAQDLLERLGYVEPPATRRAAGCSTATTSRMRGRHQQRTSVAGHRKRPLAHGALLVSHEPGAARAVGRQHAADDSDPPLLLSAMRLVALDPHGRLVEFHSIPPQVE